MSPEQMAEVIKTFFLEDNPGMWEVWEDSGTLYNSDSNRGFKPIELARAIIAAQGNPQIVSASISARSCPDE